MIEYVKSVIVKEYKFLAHQEKFHMASYSTLGNH